MKIGCEARSLASMADRARSPPDRLQCAEVELRPNCDEPAPVGWLHWLILQKFLPGKASGTSRQHALHGIGELVQRLRHAVEHAHLRSAQAQRKGLNQASQARIRRYDR